MNILRSKERVKSSGEVFTPPKLVGEILDKINKLSPDIWFDPSKTWIDPASGDGNFLEMVKAYLLCAGHSEKHILEHMLFAVDIMPDNIEVLQHKLGYLIDDKPNPILNPKHFSTDELSHQCFILNPEHTHTYLHHRNIVCANSLEYDFSFQRKEDGSDFTEEELEFKSQQKSLLRF